jgi:hypothetical protein
MVLWCWWTVVRDAENEHSYAQRHQASSPQSRVGLGSAGALGGQPKAAQGTRPGHVDCHLTGTCALLHPAPTLRPYCMILADTTTALRA